MRTTVTMLRAAAEQLRAAGGGDLIIPTLIRTAHIRWAFSLNDDQQKSQTE